MSSTGKTYSISVTLLRCLLAAWIGAAILFVITSVAEQTADNFESVTRDQLATIRFPIYYRFGFVIHLFSGVLAVVSWRTSPKIAGRRSLLVMCLIATSALLILLDYQLVYLPLQELITPPGQVRTQEFVRLHDLSRNANMVHLSVMMVAAVVAGLPLPSSGRPLTTEQ